MNEVEYLKHCKEMVTVHAIQATFNARRNAEQVYFVHHRNLGIRLRGKYRIR